MFTSIWDQGSVFTCLHSSTKATRAWTRRKREWEGGQRGRRFGCSLLLRLSLPHLYNWMWLSSDQAVDVRLSLPILLRNNAMSFSFLLLLPPMPLILFFSFLKMGEAKDNPVPVNFLPVKLFCYWLFSLQLPVTFHLIRRSVQRDIGRSQPWDYKMIHFGFFHLLTNYMETNRGKSQ